MDQFYIADLADSPNTDTAYTLTRSPVDHEPDDFDINTIVDIPEDPTSPAVRFTGLESFENDQVYDSTQYTSAIPVSPQRGTTRSGTNLTHWYDDGLYTTQQDQHVSQSIEIPLTVAGEAPPLSGALSGSRQGSARQSFDPAIAREEEELLRPKRRRMGIALNTDSRSPSSVPQQQCVMEGCIRKPQSGSVVCSKHRLQYEKKNAPLPKIELVNHMDFQKARSLLYGIDPSDRLGCQEEDDVHVHLNADGQNFWFERLLAAVNYRYGSSEGEDDEGQRSQQEKYRAKFFDQKAQYNEQLVNARLRLLLENVKRYHTGGEWCYAEGGDNAGYGVDNSLIYSERLGTICEVLKNTKRVAMDVVEGRGVNAVVKNPVAYENRKRDNAKSNDKKKAKTTAIETAASRSSTLYRANASLSHSTPPAHLQQNILASASALLHAAAPPTEPREHTPYIPTAPPYTDSAHCAGYSSASAGSSLPGSGTNLRKRSYETALSDGQSMPPPLRPPSNPRQFPAPLHNYGLAGPNYIPGPNPRVRARNKHPGLTSPPQPYYTPQYTPDAAPGTAHQDIAAPGLAQEPWQCGETFGESQDWQHLLASASPSTNETRTFMGVLWPPVADQSVEPQTSEPQAIDPALLHDDDVFLAQLRDDSGFNFGSQIEGDAQVDGGAQVEGGAQVDDGLGIEGRMREKRVAALDFEQLGFGYGAPDGRDAAD